MCHVRILANHQFSSLLPGFLSFKSLIKRPSLLPNPRKSSSHVLPFPADADPDNEHHTLVFKSAALGVEAEDKGRNVVEIHYQDRDEKEQRHVLCSLTLGRD